MRRDDEEVEGDLVFDDDNLTLGNVTNVVGVDELLTYTRQQAQGKK